MGFFISASFWQKLEACDKWLFIQLNTHFTNPVFDFILPYFRDAVFWAPLYIFILVFVALNYGKKGIWWSVAFLCTVAIADMTSSRIFKEIFDRLRPCQDPEFFQNVRLLLKKCSSSFSFTSTHAANHFGIATFVSITFHPSFKNWIYLSYVWAFFVAYAQIYVGVHYPLDILGGAAIGTLAGILTATVFNNKAGSFALDYP
ncbi:MAG: phosphatase PAP2 family protein [Chitinophagaceae bacterium]